MARDLAIDLGSANTLVYRPGDGIVFDEPTVVAVDQTDGRVVEIGARAWDLLGGDTGSITVSRPLRTGAITDFDTTQRMLEVILRRVGIQRFPRPRAIVCIPADSSAVERRAIEEAVGIAGVGTVTLVEEPLAAAIGAGLPVSEPVGSLIVDVGGGSTQTGVVSLGGVISGITARVGGYDIDEAIQAHMEQRYGLRIGDVAAETLKRTIGSAFPVGEGNSATVRGRELASGAPREIEVGEDELRAAIAGPVGRIVAAVRRTLAEAPPELTHDVLETGMFLTGGTALLAGLDLRLAEECEIAVHRTDDPLRTVVLGAGMMLDQLDVYRAAFAFTRKR